jgi:hypothetical protein
VYPPGSRITIPDDEKPAANWDPWVDVVPVTRDVSLDAVIASIQRHTTVESALEETEALLKELKAKKAAAVALAKESDAGAPPTESSPASAAAAPATAPAKPRPSDRSV